MCSFLTSIAIVGGLYFYIQERKEAKRHNSEK